MTHLLHPSISHWLRLAGVAMMAWLASLPAPAQARDTITIGETGSGSAIHWPIYMARGRGLYEAADIEIEFVSTPASAAVMQQLASGSLALGSSSFADAMRAIDRGAPVALLRVEIGPAPYEILAQPKITSFADLRGKTVMIGGVKDITRYYFERLAAPAGLMPGTYDYVFAGATSQRYAALQSRSIEATILTAPFNFTARTAGFTSLGITDITEIPFGALSVNKAWAASHAATLRKFLDVTAKGVDLFYDRANRGEAIANLQKIAKANADDAAKTYDFYVSLKAFDAAGTVDLSSIERLAKFLKQSGDLDGSTEPARFVDPSFSSR